VGSIIWLRHIWQRRVLFQFSEPWAHSKGVSQAGLYISLSALMARTSTLAPITLPPGVYADYFAQPIDHNGKWWGVSESDRVHSDAAKTSLTQDESVFLPCTVVDVLILCHLPLSPLLASVAPSPVLPLNTILHWPCRSYYLYSDIFFHQLAPILKTPIPENPRYHKADKFITKFCLIVENGKKATFQTCNVLLYMSYVMTHYHCKFGKFGID